LSTAIRTLREIAAADDTYQALLDKVGDLSKEVEVFHNLVLVATYVEPEKTSGGIIKPDKSLLEARYQGKLGVVLEVGPGAFRDDSVAKFHGIKVKRGDVVLYRPADGLELFLRGVPCRLFEDRQIKMRVQNPKDYW